jgi:hypothetical protein
MLKYLNNIFNATSAEIFEMFAVIFRSQRRSTQQRVNALFKIAQTVNFIHFVMLEIF